LPRRRTSPHDSRMWMRRSMRVRMEMDPRARLGTSRSRNQGRLSKRLQRRSLRLLLKRNNPSLLHHHRLPILHHRLTRPDNPLRRPRCRRRTWLPDRLLKLKLQPRHDRPATHRPSRHRGEVRCLVRLRACRCSDHAHQVPRRRLRRPQRRKEGD